MIQTGNKKAREEHKIEVTASQKIKQLRQAIKDDMGIKDKVSIKLFLPRDEIPHEARKEEEEELKEGEVQEIPAVSD